ncbi:MAG: phosphatidylserine decarboxylase [Planctomycetota bacterium]
MRIPLTRYGLPQVAVFPAIIVAIMVVYFLIAQPFWPPKCRCPITMLMVWLPEVVLLVVLIWVFSFFRDPARTIVQDATLLLSPADGTIAAVETLDSYPGFDGPVLRIEIFLNIFNVHINRTPCAAKIGTVTYKPGKFVDARRADCSKVNEANEIEMFRTDAPQDRMLVRQISGAIARRIVCEAKTDQTFAGGEKFGMIKFGSCTELYAPTRDNLKCKIAIGDKVKAGLTILARYE